MKVSLELIKKLPKVDLHRHLNGSIRVNTMKNSCFLFK